MKMNFLKYLGVTLIVVGFIFVFQGFDVKDNYCPEAYPGGIRCQEIKNAYVGGDAYNYIINGTYFTGFIVLGSAFIVGGIFSFVGGEIRIAIDEQKEVVKSSQHVVIEKSEKDSTSDVFKF